MPHPFVSRVAPCASLLIALLGACDEPAPEKPAPVAATPAPAAAPAPVAPAPRAPDAPSEAQVKELVDRWLAAQNGGDFAAYEALYADKMSGIKRAGPRTYHMDRKAWMSDRKRMFGKPQKVGAENLTTNAMPGAASVSFVQTYSSAGFQDRGEKRLLLLRGKAGLYIVNEEMLASSVGADRQRGPEKGFYFVVHADQPYVVLEQGISPSWSVDKPRRMHVKVTSKEEPGDYPVYMTRLDVSAALPADQRARIGQNVQVVSATGATCEARIGELTVLAVMLPWTMEQVWRGTYQEDEDTPPLPAWTDEAIDENIAGVAKSGPGGMLAAPLVGCDGEFAVEPGRPVKVLGPIAPLAPEAAQPVLELAHKSKTYAKLDAEAKAPEGSGRDHWYLWEEVRAAAAPSPYRVLRATALDGYSGGPFGTVFGLFEQDTKGGLKARGMLPGVIDTKQVNDRLTPHLLIDLDDDGTPEVLTWTSDFLGRTLISFGPKAALVNELDYADYACYD